MNNEIRDVTKLGVCTIHPLESKKSKNDQILCQVRLKCAQNSSKLMFKICKLEWFG